MPFNTPEGNERHRLRPAWSGWVAVAFLIVFPVPARAQDDAAIRRAISCGVDFLKTTQINSGGPGVGANALIGLTLLECGVSANDPSVKRVADVVRAASIPLMHTYSLALTIMFLDLLNDPADVPLIQSMGIRLLAGQRASGGWTYQCPGIDDNEARRLTNLTRQRNELRGGEDIPKTLPPARPERPVLPKEILEQLNRLEQRGVAGPLEPRMGHGGAGDNSNTQFAILGLWVARRHGVPVQKALALVGRRFHGSQNADGGWGYTPNMHSTATMTCAGLLGLALKYGAANEVALRTAPSPQDPKDGKKATVREAGRDSAVRAGLLALARDIGQPSAQTKGPVQVIPRGYGRHIYYYFWSLERVAVAYDLATIGKKDWYAWGSEVLVASQGADGSWEGEYGAAVDSSFALLFLKRANLARDLTANLHGRVKDPGEATLKAGGIGGDGLLGKSVKPEPAVGDGLADPASESDLEAAAAQLSAKLILAPADQQEKLLEQFKSAKGVVYTQALAAAIPNLGPAQGRARDALAERLARMTAVTLHGRLKDEDPEMRTAAARACAAREDPAHVPDLILLLEDSEPRAARAAREALKRLAGGPDFGPRADSGPEERAQAVAAWKQWWKDHPPANKSGP
jgi:hypothetical protein